jgi:hypothetical protein
LDGSGSVNAAGPLGTLAKSDASLAKSPARPNMPKPLAKVRSA